jgi:hypothetical protein
MWVAKMLAAHFSAGLAATDSPPLVRTPTQRPRAPIVEIVPRPDAWAACPIEWNNRASFTHSIIALLAKTMTLLTITLTHRYYQVMVWLIIS